MTGELSFGGVYVPTLLVLAAVALVLTGLVARLLAALGAYRVVSYRPLVDLSLFVIILGLLALASGRPGPPA